MLKAEYKHLAKPEAFRVEVVWSILIWFVWQKGAIAGFSPDILRRVIGDIVAWTSVRDVQASAPAIREVVAACVTEAARSSCLQLDQTMMVDKKADIPASWGNGQAALHCDLDASSTYGDVVWLVFLYLAEHGKIVSSCSQINSVVDKMTTPVRGLSGDSSLAKNDIWIIIVSALSALLNR